MIFATDAGAEASSVMKFTPATGFSGVIRLLMTYTFHSNDDDQTLTTHITSFLYWRPHEREVTAVSMQLRGEEGRGIAVAGSSLDDLIFSVFSDPRYKREFVFFLSSAPIPFRLDVETNGSLVVQADDPHWSGLGHIQLKAVLCGKSTNGSSSAETGSFELFNALPNVTMKVLFDVFVVPVASTPTLRTTVLTPFPRADSAITLRIDELVLVDTDGSEALSGRMMITNANSIAAVYANDERCTATASDGNVTKYELPISAQNVIVGMVITLLPTRNASSQLEVTVIGTARELLYSNESEQVSASAMSEMLVGWGPETTVRYAHPLDFWIEAPQGSTVTLPAHQVYSAVEGQGAANDTVLGAFEVWWQVDSGVQAVLVNGFARGGCIDCGEAVLPPLGLQLAEFVSSDQVTFVLADAFSGDPVLRIACGVLSGPSSEVVRVVVNVRISVLPVATKVDFRIETFGVISSHIGVNLKLPLAIAEVSMTNFTEGANVIAFVLGVDNNPGLLTRAARPSLWATSPSLLALESTQQQVENAYSVPEASDDLAFEMIPPDSFVGTVAVDFTLIAVVSNVIPVVATGADQEARGDNAAGNSLATVFSTSIEVQKLPVRWQRAQVLILVVKQTDFEVFEDEEVSLEIADLALHDDDTEDPSASLRLQLLLPWDYGLIVKVNTSLVNVSGSELIQDISYLVMDLPAQPGSVEISVRPEHRRDVSVIIRASVSAFNSMNATEVPVALSFMRVARAAVTTVYPDELDTVEDGVISLNLTMIPFDGNLHHHLAVFYPAGLVESADAHVFRGASLDTVFGSTMSLFRVEVLLLGAVPRRHL